MKRFLLPVLAPLLLTACDTKTEAPPAPAAPTETRTVATPDTPVPTAVTTNAFQHDPKLDGDGYYYVEHEVKVGKWVLKYINVTAPSAFAKWEAGDRQKIASPITLVLEDENAADGQAYDATHVELIPERYRIDQQVAEFSASDPRTGPVVFTGSIDFATLQAVRGGAAYSDDKPILKGDLKVGSDEVKGVKFKHSVPH